MPLDIESLNKEQKEAVLCNKGPLLVLAGAGSGKTRVLTYRIAHLLQEEHVQSWQILAITFTNKAATEMRERLGKLVGSMSRGMWVSTFHSMCVRILRVDADLLGFTTNFTIYDTDDSKRLYKSIMEQLDINPKYFPVNALMSRISDAKNNLISPGNYKDCVTDPVGKQAARVYQELQSRMKAANAMDFDDLLFNAYLLLKNNPTVLEAYQDRFLYVMIDEYQDTNKAQYEITRMLAEKNRNIMVVGDDDQSIYSWRGADIRNILEFEKDYPDAKVVKLQQNYRSVGNILSAANAVISNNIHRKPKELFSENEAGEKIMVYVASDGHDEGRWIAGEIEKLHARGVSYTHMAVFYRTNAQSRILEDMMLRAGVPYKLVGGTRFFERAEIRTIMAYLSLVINPADDIAAQRVINIPRRGIGKTTVMRIQELSAEHECSFMEACELAITDSCLRSQAQKNVADFVGVVKKCSQFEGNLRTVVEMIVERAGLITSLQRERTEEARGRIENIKEFYSVVEEYSETHDEEEAMFEAPTMTGESVEKDGNEATEILDASMSTASTIANESVRIGGISTQSHAQSATDRRRKSKTSDNNKVDFQETAPPVRVLRGNSLPDFLEWVRLRTDLDAVSNDSSSVTLMTIHAAKGLEFDCVFVAGMEEGLFPHMSNMNDPVGLEEERRLAYVAITRARKKLFLTSAGTRQMFGCTQANPMSRFVREIPDELRITTGLGSAGFTGFGWEKRGSRRGIAGSGTAGGGSVAAGNSTISGGRGFAGSGISRQPIPNPDAGKKAAAHMTFAVGETVDHKIFGRGVIEDVDGDMLTVRFTRTGNTKRLLRDFAPLVKISS